MAAERERPPRSAGAFGQRRAAPAARSRTGADGRKGEGTVGDATVQASEVAAIAPRRAEEIGSAGFATLTRQDMGRPVSAAETAALGAWWEDLEPDGALPDGGAYRRRRYGRMRAELVDDRYVFRPLPHASFRQSAEHIPHYGGRSRRFAPIDPRTLSDPVLIRLVALDVAIAVACSKATRWTVGLHLVRVIAQAGAPGRPTPEGRHRDGHDYVGMHLIDRRGCAGGESVIYRDGRPPVRLVLAEPLDSLIIDDGALTHEVTATTAAGRPGPAGVRDTLLVDLNVD